MFGSKEWTERRMGVPTSESLESNPQQPPPVGIAAPRVAAPSGRLSFDDIAKYFNLPIAEAASNLGVCTSVLKRICRENGIIRWPYRKFLAGKTVEEIRKDAARERTKDIAELSKVDKQRTDIPNLLPSTTVGPSPSYGNQVQSRMTNLAQDSSKLQPGVPIPGHAIQQQGSRSLQNGWSNMLLTNQIKNIRTYMDDFKFGFPTNGLSSATIKWWGSCTEKGTDKASIGECKTKQEEKQESCELLNESSLCLTIDDQAHSDTEDTGIATQPSALLSSLRRKAVERGRETLKIGISKGCMHYNLSKRQKLLLVEIFDSSLPDQWKESFSQS